MMKMLWVVVSAGVLAALSACAVGPDYERPTLAVPAAYGEWKQAEPALAGTDAHWLSLGDTTLQQLLSAQRENNQNIRVAIARYEQARALVASARAGFFPTLDAAAAVTRGRGATVQSQALAGTRVERNIETQRTVGLDVSWELDLWGRVRRQHESAAAAAKASAADLASVRLSSQAELAANYFQLRITDAQKLLLDETAANYRKSLDMVGNRYRAGVASRADVAQAETQWRSAQSQASAAARQRVQLEHAIAVLTGSAPANFHIAVDPQFIATQFARAERATLADWQLPPIPAGLPSVLLERRPDIAAAEHRVTAANANIGVAQAAYFPQLLLGAEGGYQSISATDWLTAPNRFWSVGPQLALTLFDGGARTAEKQRVIAAYDETVALYRQTVLSGFQEVEDNLAALRLLADEADSQDAAVAAARLSALHVTNQYRAGKVSYLDVVSVHTVAYVNARSALQILGERYGAWVRLHKALGGGWQREALAATDATISKVN